MTSKTEVTMEKINKFIYIHLILLYDKYHKVKRKNGKLGESVCYLDV